MAKSVMTLMALLVRVISIWMTPARRAKVPEISRPLAFMAGSQTCKWVHQTCQFPVRCCLVTLLMASLLRVIKEMNKNTLFLGGCRLLWACQRHRQGQTGRPDRRLQGRWKMSALQLAVLQNQPPSVGFKKATGRIMKNSHSLCEANLRRAAKTHSRVSSKVSAELHRRKKQIFRFFYWWRIEVEGWRGIKVQKKIVHTMASYY